MMSLNGDWKATDKYGSSLEFTKVEFDDSPWEIVPVPGHWQEYPAFSHYPNKMLLRRAFTHGGAQPGQRIFVRFDGVFYFARVWLNGKYLGEHTGYFDPFEFEVTDFLREGENALAVFVRCEQSPVKNERDQVLGVFEHWDCIPGEIQPGGIWGDVSLIERPETFIEALSAGDIQIEEDASEAVFHTSVKISAPKGAELSGMRLSWKLSPHNFKCDCIEGEFLLESMQPGETEASFEASVPQPHLWWTWDHGDPNLYDLNVQLLDSNGSEAHSANVRIGIRTVELRDWIFYLNGKRMFIRGSNYAPGDVRLCRTTKEGYDRDLKLARDANLNMLRVHAHVEKPEFYSSCDEAGVLIWQDFPLQWHYAPEVERDAVRQAPAMARLLGNNPCIAIWCCHNEPFKDAGVTNVHDLIENPRKIMNLLDPSFLAIFKNWNKDELDPKLKAAIEEVDTSRPILPNSGILPVVSGGTDSHLYFGWYMGTMRGLSPVIRLNRKIIRFITEYGAQAYPSLQVFRKICDASTVKDIDWDALGKRMLQKNIMDKFVPPRQESSIEEYISASQWYQARVIRYHNEMLRRYKYEPCGGAVHFLFNDALPAVTWSVLDSDRIPKQGYFALRDSFRMLLPLAELPKRWYPRGDLVSLRLWVVNDHFDGWPETELKWAYVSHSGEELTAGRQKIEIGPDTVVRAGRAKWDTASSPGGGYALVLELSSPALPEKIVNQYEFELRK